MYYIFLIQIIITVTAIYLIYTLISSYRQKKLFEKFSQEPMPAEYISVLENISRYQALNSEMKEILKPKIRYFIATKEFKGIGISVTDEIRVTVSFYACIMVINIPDECYGELKTILVYPYNVVKKMVREENWIHNEEEAILEGEATGDTVVISWNEARREAHHLRKHNVIIHEMAHILDFEDGIPDGRPPIERSKYDRWSRVLYRRYRELKDAETRKRELGYYKLIGNYAATNEAEFFAVVSEIFFQKPVILKKHFPDLYNLLKDFYRLDTVEIFVD